MKELKQLESLGLVLPTHPGIHLGCNLVCHHRLEYLSARLKKISLTAHMDWGCADAVPLRNIRNMDAVAGWDGTFLLGLYQVGLTNVGENAATLTKKGRVHCEHYPFGRLLTYGKRHDSKPSIMCERRCDPSSSKGPLHRVGVSVTA